MNKYTSTWLHCYTPRPNHEYRLICFPHAGGTASFFRDWSLKLNCCEVYSVRYPGRAERINDPQPTDLRLLAKDIAKAIQPLADCSIALFGHSMGAAVALETARELEKNGVKIVHLFASGSRDGPCPPQLSDFEEDDEAICKQLVELGGTSVESAEDPIFLELILPSIRADGKMFRSYQMELEPLLGCPVTTIFGDTDPHADIRPWRDITQAGFKEQHLPGDHFYLISTPPFTIIQNSLNTRDNVKDLALSNEEGKMHQQNYGKYTESTLIPNTIRDRNRRYVWHSWSPVDLDRTELTLSRGEGYRVWDIEGREYIDALSNNMTCGYGHPKLVAAISNQLIKLHGADLSVASHEPVGLLAKRLAQILPKGLSRTLFVNSGSEGIEAAIFIAKSYWDLIGEQRSRIISFAMAYHGSTLVSRSIGRLDETKHPFKQPFPVTHVEFPAKPRELRHLDSSKSLLKVFEEALNSNSSDKPACVVVEPFINVGGCIVLPTGFLSGLRKLCDENGALLVLDEVFTGYGRSGKMFAFQHENIIPDILVSSKGLASGYMPITAVTAQEHIHNVFKKDPILGGLRYGHTTSGHAASCAAALETLDILESENLAESAQVNGKILFERFADYGDTGHVVDVRVFGLVLILEMSSPEVAVRFQKHAKSLGLLVRLNDEAVMVVPPLIIDLEGIDKITEILKETLIKGSFL